MRVGRVVFTLAVLAAMSAACFALPATADPLRTLVYRYSSSMNGFSGGGTGGVHGAVEHTVVDSGGSDGTITVQVQAAARDGGLVIDVSQVIDRSLHPLQTVRCAVYSDPNIVTCNPGIELTPEEDTLLSYLGRSFYDPSRLDGKNHWQMSVRLNDGKGSLVTDVTATSQTSGSVTLAVTRIMKNWDYERKTTGSLLYDPKLQVPERGQFQSDVEGGGNVGHSTVDFRLLSDSFAP
jgi:hypothetical protein